MHVVPISVDSTTAADFSWTPTVNLEGKVVFAFGGAGNLAETFVQAAAACGARIALADLPPRDPERREEFDAKLRSIFAGVAAAGDAPLVLHADLTSIDDVLEAATEVKSRFGRIDIAVNFAGMHHPVFDLVRDDAAELAARFRSVIELNLNGAFFFTVALARVMVPQRSGHIIHLCSNASRLALYGSYGYNSSKHGVEGIVKTAAAQLAAFGVRVNGIAPGTVVTDLNRSLTMTPEGDYRPRAKSILAHTPTKRFLTREGVAETLLSMCVEQRHLTGNVIFPDDGYNIEGHSWPDGSEAVYAGPDAVDDLYRRLESDYPRG